MQPNPVLLRIGPISVYWYGVLIVSGAMLAAHIASKLSRRNGHDPELAWSLLLVVLVTGILGARIYHIMSSWD
ncbi:MAG: prolipoprotein diacylglyceryl transferase family protein, partial [Chloroflexota bacterium]